MKKYTTEEFLEIIRILRSENGCPWDREQTHQSLRPCMVEEAAELQAAVRIYDTTGNADNLREELGDILLQVVMHSQIAFEEGLFTYEDVVAEVSQKMIRRHPHVFGSHEADTSEKVLVQWEEIKKKEKEAATWTVSPLCDIPIELPALARGTKVAKKIHQLYQEGPSFDEVILRMNRLVEDMGASNQSVLLDRGSEEQKEIKELLEEQVGELLWNVCEMSRIYGMSPEQILSDQIARKMDIENARNADKLTLKADNNGKKP